RPESKFLPVQVRPDRLTQPTALNDETPPAASSHNWARWVDRFPCVARITVDMHHLARIGFVDCGLSVNDFRILGPTASKAMPTPVDISTPSRLISIRSELDRYGDRTRVSG